MPAGEAGAAAWLPACAPRSRLGGFAASHPGGHVEEDRVEHAEEEGTPRGEPGTGATSAQAVLEPKPLTRAATCAAIEAIRRIDAPLPTPRPGRALPIRLVTCAPVAPRARHSEGGHGR